MANEKKPIKNVDTAFKAVVYWKFKKGSNTPFTYEEIKTKRNRAYLPSHDYVEVKDGKTITNHQLALKKLDGFLAKCSGKYYTALVIFNSTLGEICVRKYNDGKLIQARELMYKAHGKNLEHTIVSGFGGNPIKLNEYEENTANYTHIVQEPLPRNTQIKYLHDAYSNLKTENKSRPSDALRQKFGTK